MKFDFKFFFSLLFFFVSYSTQKVFCNWVQNEKKLKEKSIRFCWKWFFFCFCFIAIWIKKMIFFSFCFAFFISICSFCFCRSRFIFWSHWVFNVYNQMFVSQNEQKVNRKKMSNNALSVRSFILVKAENVFFSVFCLLPCRCFFSVHDRATISCARHFKWISQRSNEENERNKSICWRKRTRKKEVKFSISTTNDDERKDENDEALDAKQREHAYALCALVYSVECYNLENELHFSPNTRSA